MRNYNNKKDEYYLPEDVLNSIDPKEKLLFNLRSENISQFNRIFPIFALIVIVMCIWIVVQSFSLFEDDSFGSEIAPVILIIAIGTAIFMVFISRPSIYKEVYYLLITDKQIHIQRNNKKEMKRWHNSSDLNTLKSIFFELKKNTEEEVKKSVGKLTFVFEKVDDFRRKNEFSIYNVPDLLENLKIIESILFQAGNFKERWLDIKKKEGYHLPQEFKAYNNILVLHEGGFNYTGEDGKFEILFSQELCLDYTYKFKKIKGIKIPRLSGTILIKQQHPSLSTLRFGPTEKCVDLLEVFYLNLCIWKNKSGYLYAKDQISNFKDKQDKTMPATPSSELKPLSYTDEGIQEIKHYLEENEEVLLSYTPNLDYKLNLGIIIIALCSIFFSLFQFIYIGTTETVFINFTFMVMSVVITIFLAFCCCFSSLFLNVKLKLNKSKFYFTNQKFIMKLLDKFYNIPFSNISSVTHHTAGNAYVVEIRLKKPMKIAAINEEYEILMPIRPKNDEVLEKVKAIRELI